MLFGWNRTSRNIFRLLPVAQPPKSQSHSRKVPSPVDASTRGSWRGGNPLFWQQHWSILIHAQSAVSGIGSKNPQTSKNQRQAAGCAWCPSSFFPGVWVQSSNCGHHHGSMVSGSVHLPLFMQPRLRNSAQIAVMACKLAYSIKTCIPVVPHKAVAEVSKIRHL